MSFFGGWLQGSTLPPKRISGELRVKDAERKEAGSRMNANIMGAPTMTQTKQTPPARIEYLRVENYRALRTVELKSLTPLTALLGPNGSGNSTVFDVFAFLSECFESGLRRAWDRRGRAKELKTRGCDGPVVMEIKYKEPGFPIITYHLAVGERRGAPVVMEQWLLAAR
jgi:hypothetical protein